MKQVQNSILTGMPSLFASSLKFDINWPIDQQLPVPKQIQHLVQKEIPENLRKNGKRSKKLAWNCIHKYKRHYAKGVCQECYIKLYYHMRAKIRRSEIV